MNTTITNETDTAEQSAKPPAPALGALVFACGAMIRCPDNILGRFPVGTRYITQFTRAPDMQRPKKDGVAMNCLLNCPCPVRMSGARVERAWAANDENREPGRMIRCKIKDHRRAAEMAGGVK